MRVLGTGTANDLGADLNDHLPLVLCGIPLNLGFICTYHAVLRPQLTPAERYNKPVAAPPHDPQNVSALLGYSRTGAGAPPSSIELCRDAAHEPGVRHQCESLVMVHADDHEDGRWVEPDVDGERLSRRYAANRSAGRRQVIFEQHADVW